MTRADGSRGIGEPIAAGAMAAYVAAVALAGILGARRARLASSPAGVGRGHLVELLTSGLPVSGPWLPATLVLAGSGLLAARAAGPQVAVVAALLAHVGGTLIAYALLALARVHSPLFWQGSWHAPDYGVSLVFAAWLAVAAVRAPNRVTGLGILLVGFALARPMMTLTGLEHACAFAIGALVALSATPRPQSTSRARALLSR